MSESRPLAPLHQSYSFSSSSSLDPAPRSFKRRHTSETLFNPSDSAASVGTYLSSEIKPFMSRRDMAHIVLPMDPSDSEPNVTFIHPPFTFFPNSHKYPQGLTYAVMAENPDWFLDANDFISPSNTSLAAICYPAQLEPPRGWCPAKKKDLRQRGSEGWPEGEEPRLRCTFCRRTYAGVNAKSMWRRHVYEKHKIAMSNRRENANPDRSRRRGSTKGKGSDNKENKKQEKEDGGSESELELSQQEGDTQSTAEISTNMPAPLTTHIQEEQPKVFLFEPSTASLGTPFTPHSLGSKAKNSLITMSPYDPLVTPTFRHSTPRLPSDQPWRFPSPSHPLHSAAQEISLASMIRRETVVPAPPNALDVSPVIFAPSASKAGVTDTPTVSIPSGGNKGFSQLNDSVKRTPGFPTSGFPQASPRRLFSLPTSRHWNLPDSPLAHNLRISKSSGSSILSASTSSSSIESDLPASPVLHRESMLMEPIRLAGDDPFTDIYNSWVTLSDKPGNCDIYSPPSSSPEDSPVVRSGQRTSCDTTIGRGQDSTSGLDDMMLMYPKEQESAEKLAASSLDIASSEWIEDHAWDEIAPPTKRRRIARS